MRTPPSSRGGDLVARPEVPPAVTEVDSPGHVHSRAEQIDGQAGLRCAVEEHIPGGIARDAEPLRKEHHRTTVLLTDDRRGTQCGQVALAPGQSSTVVVVRRTDRTVADAARHRV